MALSHSQQATVHKHFTSFLKKQGMHKVCETKDGRSYWKGRKGRLLLLFRDEKGDPKVMRLDKRGDE